MKLKAIAIAIAMMTTSVSAEVRLHKEDQANPTFSQSQTYNPAPMYDQNNDLVRHYPVIKVDPVVEKQYYNVTQHVCTSTQVPLYRDIPVTQTVEPSPSAPLVGLIVGAAIGNKVASREHRTGATVAGAIIGHSIGSSPSNRVVGYTQQHVGYHQINNCQPVSQTHSRDVIIAYQVTYDQYGVYRTITTRTHPGQYVKVVTSTRVY